MTEIRLLNEQDRLDDLIALSREFFDEYQSHHEMFFEIDVLRDSDIVAYFTHRMASDDGAVIVSLVEGKIVGYITVRVRQQERFWRIKKVGVISGLMVHRGYRRRGIGERLLARAKAFFAENQVSYFTVFTAAGNQGALDFYVQNGMSPLYTTMMGRVENQRDSSQGS
jgi:ribosomal protein S18 acetylase RimI-like enzyme